ncbi:MAG: NAD-dependent epimerase/dehydratase family protein [Dichotomicrobium sp.]
MTIATESVSHLKAPGPRAAARPNRLDSVQVLRALAALTVVVGHTLYEARAFDPSGSYNWVLATETWTAGVDLFFIISGFIMMWTFGHRFGEAGAASDFMSRRLSRIVPPYWIFTALMVMATFVVADRLESAVFTPDHAILSFLFIPHMAPQGGIHPILSVGWTLLYEMFFYATFAFVLLMQKGLGLAVLFGVFVLAHVLSLYTMMLPQALQVFWADAVMFEFFLGIGFFFIQQNGVLGPVRLILLLLFCAAALLAAWWTGILWESRLYYFGIPALALFALVYACLPRSPARGVAALVMIGGASYTLYLSHPFTLEAVKMLLEPLQLGPDMAVPVYLAMAVSAATGFSLVSYRILEHRLVRWLSRPFANVNRHRARIAQVSDDPLPQHRFRDGDVMLMDEQELKALPSAIRTGISQEQARFQSSRDGCGERRILIVGGAGYIGTPLTGHLLAAGARVRSLDCLAYHHGSSVMGFISHPRYELMPGDMGDPDTMARALAGITDVVILGGLVGDPITRSFPQAAERVNDRAICNCINAMNGRGLNKVVFVSTCSNYGIIGEDEIATETFQLKPLSSYARSKVAAEQFILSLKGQVDYAPTILRFATAFGLSPRMRFDLTVNEFTRDLFLGRELSVFDAHTWRPYCHVTDFARLIARVLDYPVDTVAFEVFNGGGDANNHTKQDIVGMILSRLPDRRVTYAPNSEDRRNYRVSFEKVKRELHFTPLVSVEAGIDEILWALSAHMLDDVSSRRTFYGNYELPGLEPQEMRSTA